MVDAVQSNRNQIKDYIERMFGQESEGNLVVFERDESGARRKHVVFPYSSREVAVDYLATQPEGAHRYLAVALHDQHAVRGQTRRQDTACAVAFLALDIDLASRRGWLGKATGLSWTTSRSSHASSGCLEHSTQRPIRLGRSASWTGQVVGPGPSSNWRASSRLE